MNRYPLTWPAGWPRQLAHLRMDGKFRRTERASNYSGTGTVQKLYRMTVAEGARRVLDELRIFGVLEGDSIISTNIPTRLDGMPRGDAKEPGDPGVAVYWERHGDNRKTKVMAIDAYATVADNLAAIAATLHAMRAIERHGGAVILDRAFEGFDALPAPGQTSSPWRDTLNLSANESDLVVIKKNWMLLRSANHPDKGGSTDQFDRINRAWAQAQQELGARA